MRPTKQNQSSQDDAAKKRKGQRRRTKQPLSQSQMPLAASQPASPTPSFFPPHKSLLHPPPHSSSIPSIPHSPLCARSNTLLPFSVNLGFPSRSVAVSKNTGVHVSPFFSLSRAFSRCASSSSCLTVVALENCLATMALVTPSQSCSDSCGSWRSVGGRTLGATERGAMSIIVVWASGGWEA